MFIIILGSSLIVFSVEAKCREFSLSFAFITCVAPGNEEIEKTHFPLRRGSTGLFSDLI